MPLVVKDRVLETSTTTGTGTLTLSGASTGYQTFSSAIGNTNTTYYAIDGGSEWEVGIGTVGAGTLTRDTILESSNGGTAVNLSAGTKNVFCTYPAEKSVDIDTAQTITNKTISVDNNTISGIVASSFVLSNASGNIDGSANQKVIPSGIVVGTTDSQTLTNKTISGASNTLSNISNSSLTNSSITVNGTPVSLGGSVSVGTVTSVGLSAGTGISISGSPITSSGSITVTNTSPDQTVALTAGTGISVTGTYPNFTITNTSSSSGTVTSVSAGNGMNFTTITGSGSVTLGTPSDISNTTSNSVSGTTHTHALSGELVETTTGSPLYYGARAWVNFNGTGTVAIRASVNVSSITDNGTGRYTINFTTAMPDANYVTLGSAWGDTAGAAGPDMSTAPTTAAVKVFTTNPGNFYDTTGANFAIFR